MKRPLHSDKIEVSRTLKRCPQKWSLDTENLRNYKKMYPITPIGYQKFQKLQKSIPNQAYWIPKILETTKKHTQSSLLDTENLRNYKKAYPIKPIEYRKFQKLKKSIPNQAYWIPKILVTTKKHTQSSLLDTKNFRNYKKAYPIKLSLYDSLPFELNLVVPNAHETTEKIRAVQKSE